MTAGKTPAPNAPSVPSDDAVRLFQLVIDNIPQFIFWKDIDSIYLGCNRNFARAAGVGTPAAIAGKTDFDLAWTTTQAEFFRQVDRRVMDSGKPEYHIIEPQKQADGKDAWLDTNKIPLFDGGGTVVGILGTFEDITDRVNAQRALLDREANLRITLNAIAEGVVATDAAGRIVRLNPVAGQLLGVSVTEVVDHPVNGVYRTALDGKPRTDFFEQVRDAGELHTSHGVFLQGAAAAGIEVAETASAIRDEAGTFTGIVVVFRDISRQREMEDRLRHAQKMDAIGQLAGGIAHDFNNMLTGIMAGAELLRLQAQKPSGSEEVIDLIAKTSRRAADLTGKLLSFSRRGRFQNRPFEMHATIRDAVELLKRSIDPRIQISVRLAAQSSTIKGDPSELESAILNLAINSRDAMPQGGSLTIASENVDLDADACANSAFHLSPGRYLQIAIQDTGGGIARELQSKVFEPFFTTKPDGQGTGLGLAAVYGTITEHRGQVTITSEPGHGTVVQLRLPLSDEAEPEQPPEAPDAVNGHGTILVVDDEDVVRSTARLLLQSLGYSVLMASHGQEGVAMFAAHHATIDLVLLDMIMPRMDGRECFRRIKQIEPQVSVVMASGFSHEGLIEDVMNEGAVGFLKKPYGRRDLAAAVGKALQARRGRTDPR